LAQLPPRHTGGIEKKDSYIREKNKTRGKREKRRSKREADER
jgi:rRNA processing protein Gar1